MAFHVPLIIRGEIIEDADLEFGGRRGGVSFTTPDVRKHLDKLGLTNRSELRDLHELPFSEILDYLERLGERLTLQNPYVREAMELCALASGHTRTAAEYFYGNISAAYGRDFVREHAENCIGVKFLDGWVERKMDSGATAKIRAFGARAVHVLAGNVPAPSALGVIRNAITRSDAIFKTPSNDPLTAAAIARTMVDMDKTHPITRHLSICYWKGGDAAVEDHIYRPENIDKIVAWGGQSSMTHITKYIQPGIDLVAMDPKLSSAILGPEAFANDDVMRECAHRLALDFGYLNQQACSSARVVYIQTGTSASGLSAANKFGKMVYEALQALPAQISGPSPKMNLELAEEIQSLKVMSDDHKVYGGGLEGAVIVSQTTDPVDFATILNDRVTNLVPFEDLSIPIRSVTSYTQTIGIYPDSLKDSIADDLILQGAQRLTSLGYMLKAAMAGPHDGIEPVRRMCKWIVNETNDPKIVSLLSDVHGSRWLGNRQPAAAE